MTNYDLGFLGGGQLARMSIQAAQRMGLRCLSLDPGDATPASEVAQSIQGRLDDPDRIAEMLVHCRRVTLENEFIPAQAIRDAFGKARVSPAVLVPGVETLAVIQDKLLQRDALFQAGVPAPKAVSLDDPLVAIAEIGFPMVLKVRFGGYDGKGTRYAKTKADLWSLRGEWEGNGWLAEEFVPFRRELAAMVYLSEWGAGCFPTMETSQKQHVCDLVFPSGTDASEIALAAVEAVGGFGLFGVEMFELESGEVLINEIAPRPHNTGHYTLDWGSISQFEQHVRTVFGLPLGAPENYLPVCMANLLGQEGSFDLHAALGRALQDSAVRVHWYGKAEMRKGRKMGHLNQIGAAGEGTSALVSRAQEARNRFFG